MLKKRLGLFTVGLLILLVSCDFDMLDYQYYPEVALYMEENGINTVEAIIEQFPHVISRDETGEIQSYVDDDGKYIRLSGKNRYERETDTEVIVYAYDILAHNKKDYWQSPAETLELKAGDCEDVAILFMTMYYCMTGIELDMGGVHTTNSLTGQTVYHAFPIIDENDINYGVLWLDHYENSVKIYSFDKVMNQATHYGARSMD